MSRKNVLTDTGIWLGLVDPKDQYHQKADAVMELIAGFKLILPWPCMYEAVSSRLVRKRAQVLFLKNGSAGEVLK